MEQDYSGQQFFLDINTRIRDLEERQKIIQDRTLLIGKSLIEEIEKSFLEIQNMKKTLFQVKEDVLRSKEIIQRMAEQLSDTAKREELMILQRQFDLFREE